VSVLPRALRTPAVEPASSSARPYTGRQTTGDRSAGVTSGSHDGIAPQSTMDYSHDTRAPWMTKRFTDCASHHRRYVKTSTRKDGRV
jgi:hypothetical protein